MTEGFAIRHRLILLVLWIQVPVVAVLGLSAGLDGTVVGGVCLLVVALAVGGMLFSGSVLPATAVAIGLTTSSMAVVGFSGNLDVAHLYFPVILASIACYRLKEPLLTGLAGMAIYHLTVGLTGPEGVTWAVAHTGFLFLMCIVLMAGWRLAGSERDDGWTGDRYWTSFHAAPIGMAVLKPSGEFLEANPAMSHLLGYEPGHFPGRNIRALIDSDDLPILGDAWETIGNNRGATFSAWLRCLTADSGSIWARVSLALVPRTEEQSAMVILQVEDATSARNEHHRLERLLHGKDEFVALVGKEIREPLDAVIDLTSGNPELVDIHSRASQAASVVDDLVASARADIAPPDVVPEEFDAAAVCQRLLGSIPGGDTVAVDIRARKMWADPDLTRQIMTGMLGNAIRYGGPHVRVQIFNSGPDTVVQVIDDGPAVPAAAQERIFNGDLRQGEPVTRPAAVGLSLTVGRHLARRMEGEVVYRRSGDGVNIFELRLPSQELTKSYRPRPRPTLSKKLG